MDDWQPLARLSQLNDGAPLGVTHQGLDLVMIRHGAEVEVLEGRCPHQGTLLSDGTFQNGVLTCPAHGWRFHTDTGTYLDNPKICLRRFPTEIRKDEVGVSQRALEEWRGELEKRKRLSAPRRLKPLHELPGPRRCPLVGNLPQVKDLHLIHHDLLRWADEFGSIYRFQLGTRKFLAVSDVDLIQDILRRRPDTFRRISRIESIFSELHVRGLFSSEGETWRRQRQLTMPAFSPNHLHRFFDPLQKIAGRLCRRWEKQARQNQDVPVQKDLMRFTVDITSSLAFGTDMNTLENDGDVIQNQLEHVFPTIWRRLNAMFPYWRYITLPRDRKVNEALRLLQSKVQELIQITRERMAAQPELLEAPTNFLEGLLASSENGERLTSEELFGNVMTILVAGEDTTANAMAWMIHFMIDRPDVQAKMQAEADAILGERGTLARYEDHEKLTYIEAVANESMRFHPVGPFLFLEAKEDTEIGGVEIPAGTMTAALIWHPMLQEKNFTRAREFAPERWLPAHRAQFPVHQNKAFMPFGAGARFCPGRSLAMLEIKVAMATLCHHFTVKPPRNGEKMKENMTFVVAPTNLWASLDRRREAR